MPRDIIDDRLIGSLHLRVLDRNGFARTRAHRHRAFQVGTISGLMQGHYAGELTLGELLAHGDLGIGTVAELAGELVVVDGEAFVAGADRTVRTVSRTTTTPFAVLCPFRPQQQWDLVGPLDWPALTAAIDARIAPEVAVVGIRVDGRFTDLHLRSVHAQRQPYPPLTEVVAHQVEWHLDDAVGTLVGFRFPDDVAGIEVPGYHLHFISADRSHGGHVISVTCAEGRVATDSGDELVVESTGDAVVTDPVTPDDLEAVEGRHAEPPAER